MSGALGIHWLFPELADGTGAVLPIGASGDVDGDLTRARAAIAAHPPRPGDVPILVFAGEVGGDGPVQTRLHPSWKGLLPGDRWPPATRAAYLDLLGALHPARVGLFLTLENLALGGLPLPEAADITTDLPDFSAAPHKGGPLIVAVCGIDGSGKSTHLAALRDFAAARGARVAVHKIFRHGVFHETVTDLVRSCAGGVNLHLWRLERLAKVFDSVKFFFSTVAAGLATHDVLLFDRYVYTHFAAILGRSLDDPFARELLAVFPRPHYVALLDLPARDALERIGSRHARTLDENAYMLGRYRTKLLEMAGPMGFQVLDAREPFDANQAILRRAMAGLMDAARRSAS